jgi:hypothetical protein
VEFGFDDDDPMEEDLREIFYYLLDNGYMEEVGYDFTGEPIYKMTPKMLTDFPDLFEAHLAATNETIFALWQKGLLEMNMTSDGEWTVMPTHNTFHYNELDIELQTEEVLLLDEIARVHIEKGQKEI